MSHVQPALSPTGQQPRVLLPQMVRRPRWTAWLIGLTVLLALAVIVLEIIILRGTARRADGTAAITPSGGTAGGTGVPPVPPAVPTGETPVPPDVPTGGTPVPPDPAEPAPAPAAPRVAPPSIPRQPAEQPAPAKPAVPNPAREPLPAPPTPPPAPPAAVMDRKPAVPAAPAAEPLLEALGGLTAASLYQTYLNIGLLADATEHAVYAPADARKVLQTVTDLIDTADRQLAALPEAGLQEDERKALARSRTLLGLMRTQTRELRAYWDTGKKEHAAQFHKAREEAWAGIKDTLGIKE
jgi:hypothetical protein